MDERDVEQRLLKNVFKQRSKRTRGRPPILSAAERRRNRAQGERREPWVAEAADPQPQRGGGRLVKHVLRPSWAMTLNRNGGCGVYQTYLLPLLAMALFVGCSAACRSSGAPAATSPAREMDWAGPELEWGQTSDGFFGLSSKRVLETWRWSGDTVTKGITNRLPEHVLHTVVLPGDRYLANIGQEGGPYPLVIASVNTNGVLKSWPPPAGWYYSHTGSSVNGKFAAALLEESVANPPPDYDDAKPRTRVGLVTIETRELVWVAELTGDRSGTIGQVAVSDDGKCIALGGWNHGVAFVETTIQQVHLVGHPPGAGSLASAAFSSNGEILYAADEGGGGVYALETKTGNVLRRWVATTTGEDIYGHRISCLALSPDGAWIAAGTGPEGQVFLFNTASSEVKPVLFDHGLSTILIVSFAPDSKYLASVAKGKVKVWAVPSVKGSG